MEFLVWINIPSHFRGGGMWRPYIYKPPALQSFIRTKMAAQKTVTTKCLGVNPQKHARMTESARLYNGVLFFKDFCWLEVDMIIW